MTMIIRAKCRCSLLFRLCLVLMLALPLGISGGAAPAAAAGAQIHAALDRQEISLDGQATLIVSISGSRSGSPEIPRVEGLRIMPAGQSSRFEIVNSRVSQSVEYIYNVRPSRAGDFTIPAISLAGDATATDPLQLRVVASTTGLAGDVADPRAGIQDDAAGPAFLKMYPAKSRLYVGEVVPVEIVAFFRQGTRASVQAAPQLSGSAFSLTHHTEKPRQTQEIINGEPYTALTWHGALCALKEGEYPLGAALDVVMAVPVQNRRPPQSRLRGMHGDDFFNDSFFDDFFNSVQEKEVRLESDAQAMPVLPLPERGRPADYSGAIGRFTVEASAQPDTVAVGDPLTLTVLVSGRGNFDRLALPGLADIDGWKAYTPSAQFKSADGVGYEGVKEFEQALIPKDASRKEIPSVTLCYFDPDAHRYVTASTPAIPVRVDPAERRTSAPAAARQPAEDSAALSPEPAGQVSEGGLAPLHAEFGNLRSLRPLPYRPWFWGLQAVPLLLLAAGLYLQRRRPGGTGRDAARGIRHIVKTSLAEMERAIAEDDAPAFFRSCRHAAQVSLGRLWGIPPAAITRADVEQRLNDRGAGIRQVFETADAVAYSGRPLSQSEMRQCRDRLLDELTKLEENHAHTTHR